MVANPQRRERLADAGLRVLAAFGARGLTHRAVDAEAGVPMGTASNYFRSRDDLLGALAERILERIAPDPRRLAALAEGPPSVERMIGYLRYIHERTTFAGELTVALFELRLEARRRPELARILGETLRLSYASDVRFNEDAGLPGGAFEIALLHYAVDGFLLDQLTTPIDPGSDVDRVLSALARRLVGAVEQPASRARRGARMETKPNRAGSEPSPPQRRRTPKSRADRPGRDPTSSKR
jgi:AcrR family transcriptional regulator